MPVHGIFHGRSVALTLDRVQMQDTRAAHVLDFIQHFHHFGDVVAVKGTEIAYVKAFEYVLLSGNKRF